MTKEQSECENQKGATIHNVRFDSNFTIISNSTAADPNLSWGAKGLLLYILSRPPNWEIHTWQLAKIYTGERKGNGMDAVLSLLKELKNNGYVDFQKTKDAQGRWKYRYDVYPMPMEQFKKIIPQPVEPALDSPALENPGHTIRTDLNKTEQGIVCVPSSPVAPSSPLEIQKIVKLDFSGKEFTVSKQDLYVACIQNRKDWEAEDIDYAWKTLVEYTAPVRDWFKFCVGTISHYRKLKGIKKLDQEKPSCKKKTDLCVKQSNMPQSKSQAENIKENVSEKDTWVRPFANSKLPNPWQKK